MTFSLINCLLFYLFQNSFNPANSRRAGLFLGDFKGAFSALLGGIGLLQGKSATCYPGFEDRLTGARLQAGSAVVVDGLVTTGRGPGLTLDFALALVEQLAGKAKRDEVAGQLLLAH